MSRVPIVVRDAVQDDASVLSALWQDLVEPAARAEETATEVAASAVQRFASDPTARVVVAELNGTVVGCAFLRASQLSPLEQDRVVHVSHVQVQPDAVRQGIGRGLMEAAVSWAEDLQIETVVVATPADHRDGHRFLARLGLAQVAVLRGAPVEVLRTRLPHLSAAATRQRRSGRSLGQVVAARRSQRRARNRPIVL